jgi:uncharacterized protein (DUF849 family)
MSKIIISCAVTGSIHTPSMSPYLPVTAEAIAEQAIGAANAGAAILHLHARDPGNGRPSASVEHYMGFLPAIKAGTDAVVNLTTGGSAVMTLEQRLAGPLAAKPEMCSLNMGTMNFALYPMLGNAPNGCMTGKSRSCGTPMTWFSRTPRGISKAFYGSWGRNAAPGSNSSAMTWAICRCCTISWNAA